MTMTNIVNKMLCFVSRYRCAKNRFSPCIETMDRIVEKDMSLAAEC